MSIYELAILGDASAEARRILTESVGAMVNDFGLSVGVDIVIHDGESVTNRDTHVACAAAYFGGPTHSDLGAARALVSSSVPIIPTVSATGQFGSDIPDFLQPSNGLRRRDDDPGMTELAAALLECVGLLPTQRRVFVSYRRVESRTAAVQLHDGLSGRGFDVFLDTHDIRPGAPFQEMLWHRLCDSDVMVMLDTPSYFDSRWTRQEVGRARAKGIHVLRVVWPGHIPNKMTDLAETIYLEKEDLVGSDGPLVAATMERIILGLERLRSRSIAARYMSITGRLRVDADKIGATVEGVGAHRAVAIRLINEQKLWVYPVVGVPTAETLHQVADRARRASHCGIPVLLYDHIGIRDSWNEHLRWLDEQIRAVRAIKVAEAGWTLAGWES